MSQVLKIEVKSNTIELV
jgi:hypothetical protein